MIKRIAAIGVLAGSATAAGCGQTEGAEAQRSGGDEAVRTVNVEVLPVERAPFSHFIRVVGTVEAQRDVRVSAEESGVVETLLASKGEMVSVGEPILRLDGDVLSAQAEQAASQAELAQETWQRQRQLWERDSVGTEMAYLQAKYNAQTARAQAEVLARRMARTVVRAPVAGILDDRMVEVGSMVSAGTPVVRILDVDTVKVVGGVPERYAADIEEGAEVTVAVNALGGRRYTGSIDFVGSSVDSGNRTFGVEVVVPNPGLGIKPGMVADIQIARHTLEEAIAVPRHAVLRREDGYIVYVAAEGPDGLHAETRSVIPGASRGEMVVIESGLEPGERVVTVGQQRVTHGDALVIVNGQPDPEAQPEAGADTASAAEPQADGGEG